MKKNIDLFQIKLLNNLPHVEEWIEKDLLKKNNFLSWRECIISLHQKIGKVITLDQMHLEDLCLMKFTQIY